MTWAPALTWASAVTWLRVALSLASLPGMTATRAVSSG